MAQQAQDTFVAVLDDGTERLVRKGEVLPDSHELVKRDAKGAGILFRPLNIDGDEPGATRATSKAKPQMPLTPPGWKVWEYVTPATVAGSPVVSGWFDTSGYTNLFISYVFTNSGGSTTLTVEGSFDGSTLETDITYSSVGATPATVAVLHPYVRFRIVQATADATRTKACVQARA